MSSRTVTLVAGPPCAGKTTYVTERAQPGDLVLDQDALGATEYNRQLERVATMDSGAAWVIRCAPGPTRREDLARRIRATDTVLLLPPLEVLLTRAIHRPNRRRQIQAVRKWFRHEADDATSPTMRSRATRLEDQETRRGRSGRPWSRLRSQVFREESYCWQCGLWVDQSLPPTHRLSRTVDHIIELQRGGDPLERTNCRLAHRACNTARSNRLRSKPADRTPIVIDLASI